MEHRKKSRAGKLALFAIVSLLAGLGFSGTSSAASRFKSVTWSCGKAVVDPKAEHPTFVLKADIGPCAGDGLIFKASNVTLDLNGFEIKGMPLIPDGPDAGSAPDGGFGEGVGIRIVGNSNITITNSKHATNPSVISDFDAGIVIQRGANAPAKGNTVKNLAITGNVGLQGSPPFFLGGSPCTGGDPEVACEVSDFNDGLALIGAEGNTIGPNNLVDFNGSGGIRLDDGAKGNTVVDNRVQDNLGNGVRFMALATENLVTGNTLTRNAAGVNFSFENPDNVIHANTIVANRGFGVATGYHSERTTISENQIQGNRSGGITLGSGENLVEGNTIVGNGFGATGTGRGNGIFVGSGTDNFPRVGTVVRGNHVHNNAGNGIRIGCLLDQDPDTFAIYGCLVWDTHNAVVDNVATGNAVNGPSGTQSIAGGQVVGWYDLLDSTNTLATQSPFDPAGVPLTDCGTNSWSGNTFSTAFPACTAAA